MGKDMVRKNLIKKGLAISNIILFIGISVIPSASSIIGYSRFSPELIIDGPTQGVVGEPLEYFFILTDIEGCEFHLYIDWDDGTNTGWLGPYLSSEEIMLTHVWYESGS